MSFEFCLPTKSTSVPDTPDWLHEVKYDGYRLRLERDGDRVRMITRGGYNWSDRYPWIVEAALKHRFKQFVIDGEAVVLGVDGVSDFNALHSRKHDDESATLRLRHPGARRRGPAKPAVVHVSVAPTKQTATDLEGSRARVACTQTHAPWRERSAAVGFSTRGVD